MEPHQLYECLETILRARAELRGANPSDLDEDQLLLSRKATEASVQVGESISTEDLIAYHKFMKDKELFAVTYNLLMQDGNS